MAKDEEKGKGKTLEEKLVSAGEKIAQSERIISELRDALRVKDEQINNAQDEINRLKAGAAPPETPPLPPTGSAGAINL